MHAHKILAADFPHRSIPALTTCMYTRKQARGISQQSRPRPAPNHSHPWSAEEKACLERHIDIWTASTSGLNMLKYVEQVSERCMRFKKKARLVSSFVHDVN